MTSGLLSTTAAHPLETLVGELEESLERHGQAPAWTMTASGLAGLLPRLHQVRRRLEAAELRLLREADRHQVGDAVGAANTGAWWANQTRQVKPAAFSAVSLAARLDDEVHEPTASAVASGAASADQAAVILEAVEALPAELVGPALRLDAEQRLVALAEHHDPRELRILGRKILEVIAPEAAEEHERRILERQEQHAAATADFTMRPDGHGSMHGRFKIPVLAGEILAQHLAALAAPKHRHATATDVEPRRDLPAHGGPPEGPPPGLAEPQRVSRRLRLGHAFIEYIETRDPGGTPKAGGLPATIVVTMTLADLLGTTNGAAHLDTGTAITAGEARRLACEAGIIPAVLGTRSQVLDLGRKTRFHTTPQRIALALRDRGCAAEGCDWPPGSCHAHHPTPWAAGGRTSITNGMLLCPRHHTLAHDARYQLKTSPSGKVTFSRRT